MNLKEIEKLFDKQYDHDNPCGKALVLIESHEGGTSQTPVANEIKRFWSEQIVSLLETLRMDDMDSGEAPADNAVPSEQRAFGHNLATRYINQKINDILGKETGDKTIKV